MHFTDCTYITLLLLTIDNSTRQLYTTTIDQAEAVRFYHCDSKAAVSQLLKPSHSCAPHHYCALHLSLEHLG